MPGGKGTKLFDFSPVCWENAVSDLAERGMKLSRASGSLLEHLLCRKCGTGSSIGALLWLRRALANKLAILDGTANGGAKGDGNGSGGSGGGGGGGGAGGAPVVLSSSAKLRRLLMRAAMLAAGNIVGTLHYAKTMGCAETVAGIGGRTSGAATSSSSTTMPGSSKTSSSSSSSSTSTAPAGYPVQHQLFEVDLLWVSSLVGTKLMRLDAYAVSYTHLTLPTIYSV